MVFVNWKKYPNVKILFNRVLEHRRTCEGWKNNVPCFDCHCNTLTKIEEELSYLQGEK